MTPLNFNPRRGRPQAIACIRNLLSHSWEVKVQHVEANFYVDFMTKLGIEDSAPHVLVDAPPPTLIHMLHVDAISMSFVRL